MNSKLKFLSVALVLSSISLTDSLADTNTSNNYDWIIRSRALYVKTDVNSSVSTLGGGVAATSDQVPEIDFTHFFTKNIAAELILATTHHDINLRGSVLGENAGLGSVNLLPPTLTAQYHFNPDGKFRPYAGAGLNYTFFYGAKTGGAATDIKYNNHLGYALQTGFDYMLNDRFGINFDVKKIYLKTNVEVNNLYNAKVALNPWLIGAGISYRF